MVFVVVHDAGEPFGGGDVVRGEQPQLAVVVVDVAVRVSVDFPVVGGLDVTVYNK